MDKKKYGVSISALKSLQHFQRSLLNKKRKVFEMPFHGECLLSIDNREPLHLIITADSGIVSSDSFGVIYLKNRVKSIDEMDTEVIFEAKEPIVFFRTMAIKFNTRDDKTHFMTSIKNVLSPDSDDSSSSSDDSGDSGLK